MPHLESATDLVILSSHSYGSSEVRTSILMEEFANKRRVYFVAEPITGATLTSTYLKSIDNEVTIIQPYLPSDISIFESKKFHLQIIRDFVADENIANYTIWTDTPQAMPFIRKLSPEIIIYDCQKDYSSTHRELEKELFLYADVVLTSALKSEPSQFDITIANTLRHPEQSSSHA